MNNREYNGENEWFAIFCFATGSLNSESTSLNPTICFTERGRKLYMFVFYSVEQSFHLGMSTVWLVLECRSHRHSSVYVSADDVMGIAPCGAYSILSAFCYSPQQSDFTALV